jgi:hypothetical protein
MKRSIFLTTIVLLFTLTAFAEPRHCVAGGANIILEVIPTPNVYQCTDALGGVWKAHFYAPKGDLDNAFLYVRYTSGSTVLKWKMALPYEFPYFYSGADSALNVSWAFDQQNFHIIDCINCIPAVEKLWILGTFEVSVP